MGAIFAAVCEGYLANGRAFIRMVGGPVNDNLAFSSPAEFPSFYSVSILKLGAGIGTLISVQDVGLSRYRGTTGQACQEHIADHGEIDGTRFLQGGAVAAHIDEITSAVAPIIRWSSTHSLRFAASEVV
jgi:hypothetical protein